MKREIPVRCGHVSLILLRRRESEAEVLLLRRTGPTLAGEWCQIAGGIEEGEPAWRTALREAEEETGLILDELWSADLCEQFYEADRDAVTLAPVFVAWAPPEAGVRLNPEHSEFRWLGLEAAEALLPFPGQRAVLRHVRREFVERAPHPLLRVHGG